MRVDAALFAEIYDELAPKIVKYCYFRVSSMEEAEDITSSVFLRVWDHVASGKKVKNFKGFIYKTANNLIIDHYRKKKDKIFISIDNDNVVFDIPDEKIDLSESFDIMLFSKKIKSTLEKLPENLKVIVIMRYINDLSVKEISEILGTSENNVSVRLYRAVEKLKSIL